MENLLVLHHTSASKAQQDRFLTHSENQPLKIRYQSYLDSTIPSSFPVKLLLLSFTEVD